MSGRRNSFLLAQSMRDALMARPMTVEELAEFSGLSLTAARRWLTSIRRSEKKTVYIQGWAKDTRGRLFVPRWRWGNKPDAERAGPQRTSTDRMRDLAARRRAAQC